VDGGDVADAEASVGTAGADFDGVGLGGE
jgi:hypothetical protein